MDNKFTWPTWFLTVMVLLSASGAALVRGQGKSPVRGQTNHIRFNAEQSTNWAGYAIAGGPFGFNSVHGTWAVPAIASSTSDTTAATWVGIGGGCVNPPSCTETDPTLIQAGIESDNISGSQSYSAWWEAIPAPSVSLSGGLLSQQSYDVQPGDSIAVNISVQNFAVWTIEVDDQRGGQLHWTFTTTVPYLAAGLTAEWIEESPLTAGTSGAGQTALSDFHQVIFDGLTANGANPGLTSADEIVLDDGSGNVLAMPSAPQGGNSFAVCYGSGTCDFTQP